MNTRSLTGPQFSVFANPYCLWCYAFEPALHGFRHQVRDGEWTLVMGELFSGVNAPPITSDFIRYLQQHAARAQEYAGVEFGSAFWSLLKKGGQFNSSNATQAMRAVIYNEPNKALAAFADLQQRLFVEGQDISSWFVLQQWARENGISDAIWREWPTMARAAMWLRQDEQLLRRLQLNAYPAVLYRSANNQLHWIARGFSVMDAMMQRYQQHVLPHTGPTCTTTTCRV
jgi:protein-disulfide isomerase-like protein with CxxC motif